MEIKISLAQSDLKRIKDILNITSYDDIHTSIVETYGNMLDVREGIKENHADIYFRFFNSHGLDSKLKKYDNCLCEVTRELTEEEADIGEVGKMYHVKFADGYETDVFEDELF